MLSQPQFDPQGDLAQAKENVALASTSRAATFTDSNHADPASFFTATIDWGDGQTTPGTVVGSNGSFTVEGGHTYGDENQFPALITVTNTVDSEQLIIGGTVPVADTDTINPHPVTLSYTVNQPLTNVTVATFSDPTNPSNPASDFIAQIDWGDGATDTGTVQGSAGSFSVVGSHTYTTAGANTIVVEIADDAPDAATGSVNSTAVSGFGGQVSLTAATEGTALTGAEVATFVDASGSHAPTDYTAKIKWGDGTTTSGTVSGSGQSFTVTGDHTYADEVGTGGGSPVLTVDITRTADSATAEATGTVNVADADILTMHSQTIGGSPNVALSNVKVATFSDAYTGQTLSDLAATIDWGDGSTTDVGTLSGGAGSFTVSGSHTYSVDGQYNVNVAILEDLPAGEGQINAVTSTVNIGLVPGTANNFNVPEGTPISGQVATFSDGNSADTVADFTASVDWGDGQTTAGTVSGSNGSFTVTSGPHAYGDEGDDTVTTTVTRTADGETATMTGTATVAEADGFAISAHNFSGNPGVVLNNVPVATFTDTFTGQVANDLPATIEWGDGQTTAGTVSGGSGSFTVTGSHTYANGGNYFFHVNVADDPPGTSGATANGTATINFAGNMVLNSATEGTAIANGTPVATFNDSNGGDTPSDFTATINWGDGTSSAGTVSGGAGTFTVSGGHTYADEGNDQASVILTHTVDQAASTVSGSVSVGEADVFVAHGTSFTANSHQVFSGTVATFDDTGFPGNVAGDFTAIINWGDSTPVTVGTVTGGNGSFTVSGSHTYAAAGQDIVSVTLTDDAPGTASITANSTATVNQGIGIPYDFNGDTISDLVFQNEAGGAATGTPQIWLWNGTAVTSQMAYPNPGASWHIVTSRDVNGDGDADLIWQDSGGTPGIWLMNGTTPIAQAGLTNPGPTWHLVASGDTNGDGRSDLVWQNTDGTLGVWLMNGTTPIAEAAIGNPGSTWKVVGTADYNGDNRDDILLQNTTNGNLMIDLMNGTSVSSTVSISVGDPAWHAVSTGEFNGQAEIAWQNDNGTPGIWLFNGTTPVAKAGLQNPSPGWQLISVDHFTPDGHADLLFQNTSGAMGLWELNGTTIVSEMNLPNPGTGQQSENGHPFTPPTTVTVTGPPTTNGANADLGGGTLHLSAPDSGVGSGPGSPSNLQHMAFAGR